MQSTFKQIVFLLQPDGDVVAHHVESGHVVGSFCQNANGEICFNYCDGTNRSWYVNRNLPSFRAAAQVFNRFCEHYRDENLDDDASWSLASAQLNGELEQIEPLGDSDTSLWKATVQDAEGGLLSLF